MAKIETKQELVKLTLSVKGYVTKVTGANVLHRDPAAPMGGIWMAKSKVASVGKNPDGTTFVMVTPERAAYYEDRHGLKIG